MWRPDSGLWVIAESAIAGVHWQQNKWQGSLTPFPILETATYALGCAKLQKHGVSLWLMYHEHGYHSRGNTAGPRGRVYSGMTPHAHNTQNATSNLSFYFLFFCFCNPFRDQSVYGTRLLREMTLSYVISSINRSSTETPRLAAWYFHWLIYLNSCTGTNQLSKEISKSILILWLYYMPLDGFG